MIAHLCSGANLGDPPGQLDRARLLIGSDPGIRILRLSSMLRSKPYGFTAQPDFWNQVLEIETEYSPEILLGRLLEIERQMGRVRAEKWGPRTIDLDILLCGDLVLQTDDLVVPHPGLPYRAFVLRLLIELIPDMLHPQIPKTISELYDELTDKEDTHV